MKMITLNIVHTEGTPVVLYVRIERDIHSGAMYIHTRSDIHRWSYVPSGVHTACKVPI